MKYFTATNIILVVGFFFTIKRLLKMPTKDQFDAAISRIDTATDAIAQVLRDLKDQIKGGGLDEATEDAVLGTLESAATKLEAVGKEEEPT